MDLKAKVLARMNQARKVAICVDIWSKKGLTASFLGVTAHFFTPQDHKTAPSHTCCKETSLTMHILLIMLRQ